MTGSEGRAEGSNSNGSSSSRFFSPSRNRSKSVSAKSSTRSRVDELVVPAVPAIPPASYTQTATDANGATKLRSKRHSRNASVDAQALAILSLNNPPTTRGPPSINSETASTSQRLRKVPSRLQFWQKEKEPTPTSFDASSSTSSVSTTASKRSKSLAKRSSPDRLSASSNQRSASVAAQASVQSANELFPKRITGWFTQIMHNANTSPTKTYANAASPDYNDQAAMGASTFSQKLSSPLRTFSINKGSTSPEKQMRNTSPKQGRAFTGLDRILDRASNYFFDTDANVDKNPADIWVLGVRHDGWRSEPAEEGMKEEQESDLFGPVRRSEGSLSSNRPSTSSAIGLDLPPDDKVSPSPSARPSTDPSDASFHSASSTSFIEATTPHATPSISETPATPIAPQSLGFPCLPTLAQTNGWPPSFYLDFTSRIQLVYRSNFPSLPLADPFPANSNPFHNMVGTLAASIGRNGSSGSAGPSARGLTSDTGWGCMLRTGQSLLANALMKIHLGRDWRRPLPSPNGEGQTIPPPLYSTYVRLATWFADDPSELAPFSVHRFATVGKQLGKEIGQWFGPSTAAGAIKSLCNDFSPAQLGVTNAVDGTVYATDLYAASQNWTRPVLVLLNLRLGIQGINPIYHPSLKAVFTFPQSIGIAGGRPSSSYYFVGAQENNLFYIDPHHTAESIPLQQPPEELHYAALNQPLSSSSTATEDSWQAAEKDGSSPIIAEDSSTDLDAFYMKAYAPSPLDSFHPDKVRRIALSGIDPSMLVGFVIKDEADWQDWRQRSLELKPALYAIAEKAPTWVRMASSSPAPPSLGEDFSMTASGDESPEDWDITDSEGSGIEQHPSREVM